MRKWLFGIALGLAAVTLYLRLNYAGYCFAEGRLLSDREKIEVGVTWLLEIYPPSVNMYETKNGERVLVANRPPSDPIRYAGLDDFFARNPDCCQFSLTDRQNDKAPTLERLLGDLSGFANVTYLVRYRGANGEEVAERIRLDQGVSNCGKLWHD